MKLIDTVSSNKISVSWRSPYVSEAINESRMSNPVGIVRGFLAETSDPPTNSTLVLKVDPVTNDSVLVANSDGKLVTYRVETDLILDVGGLVVGVAEWYLVFYPDYTVGSDTTGEWRAYSDAEFEAGLPDGCILVCVFDNQYLTSSEHIRYSGMSYTDNIPFRRQDQILDAGGSGRKHIELIYENLMDQDPESSFSFGGMNYSKTIDYTDFKTGFGSLKLEDSGDPAGVIAMPGASFTIKKDPGGLSRPRFICEMLVKFVGYTRVEAQVCGLDLQLKSADTVGMPASAIAESNFQELIPVNGDWFLWRSEVQVPDNIPEYLYATPILKFEGDTGGFTGVVKIDNIKVWRYNYPTGFKGLVSSDYPKSSPFSERARFSRIKIDSSISNSNINEFLELESVSGGYKLSGNATDNDLTFGDSDYSHNYEFLGKPGEYNKFDLDDLYLRSTEILNAQLQPIAAYQGDFSGVGAIEKNLTFDSLVSATLVLNLGLDPLTGSVIDNEDVIVMVSVKPTGSDAGIPVWSFPSSNKLHISVKNESFIYSTDYVVSVMLFRASPVTLT